jgi:hypothetical protein
VDTSGFFNLLLRVRGIRLNWLEIMVNDWNYPFGVLYAPWFFVLKEKTSDNRSRFNYTANSITFHEEMYCSFHSGDPACSCQWMYANASTRYTGDYTCNGFSHGSTARDNHS